MGKRNADLNARGHRILVSSVALLVSFLNASIASAARCTPLQLLHRLKASLVSASDAPTLAKEYGLHPVVARWLVSRSSLFEGILPLSAGDFLRTSKGVFPVLADLGTGQEAQVYLVRMPSGLAVAKVFHLDFLADEGEASLREMREKGIRGPTLLGRQDDTLLMEYIEGVPIDEVRDRWRDIGLSSRDRDGILSRYEAAKAGISARLRSLSGHPVLLDRNVVYSFKDRGFHIIDAH